MHVDRGRFLMITAAMAAGGCGPEPPAQAPVPVADPAAAADHPLVHVPPPSGRPAAGEGSLSDPSGGDQPSPWGDEPRSGFATDPEAPNALEPTHGPSDLVARCQQLRPPPGPHCEGFHWTQALCEAFDRALQPPVARAAVNCLLRHSGRDTICRPDAREDCFTDALRAQTKASRHDRGRCGPVVSQCTQGGWSSKLLTKANCRRAVAAVRPAFRDEMITCITESCGLRECVYVVEP